MGLARIVAEAERLRIDLYPKRRLSRSSVNETAEAQAILAALAVQRPDLFADVDFGPIHRRRESEWLKSLPVRSIRITGSIRTTEGLPPELIGYETRAHIDEYGDAHFIHPTNQRVWSYSPDYFEFADATPAKV